MRSGILALMMVFVLAAAQASDLHRLWDGQCGGCHGHAGAFARASLTLKEGRLFGLVSQAPVDEYLVVHNGGYGQPDIAALRGMLAAQLSTPPLFADICGTCHDNAAELTRDSIRQADDGALLARDSGSSLAEYLPKHARLTPEQSRAILSVLERVYGEVHHR